jgi:hypothetical protein
LELEKTTDPAKKKVIEEEIKKTEKKLDDQYARGRYLVQMQMQMHMEIEAKRRGRSSSLIGTLLAMALKHGIAAAALSQVENMTDAALLGVINECMIREFNRKFSLDLQVLGPSVLHWKRSQRDKHS